MKKEIFFLFLLCALGAVSQTRISGEVVDNNGAPVPFANVVFQNSSEGTTTNEDGKFYLQSPRNFRTVVFSLLGYRTRVVPLENPVSVEMKIVLEEKTDQLGEVRLVSGKTSKKNNPAVDILKKIWKNKRKNGVKAFDQYQFQKYEKLEFDLNGIDSTVVKNPLFNGMEFIFDYADTNNLTGKTYLPVFINESVSRVYGDNIIGEKTEEVLGNKNSGFSENQNLIAMVKDVYDEYDIYDNYLKFFDKSFVSPLSQTGINTYNYVLADTAYIEDKLCYNIIYYPRRQNELTFKGNFWVNDSTWAIKKINLETSKDANINWVRNVYIEQEFNVLNDSVFLLTRDFFMVDFSYDKKDKSGGIYGKKTVLYNDYHFNKEKPRSFYKKAVYKQKQEIYSRSDGFWEENRREPLSSQEKDIYVMLDSLKQTKAFNRLYDLVTIAESGYVEFDGWDFGPVYSLFGYNQVEGFRTRLGGRTYFGQNDLWRIEGYGAYGFKDNKFKYGISGKLLLDKKLRLIISGGNRRDVEQLGASLTNSTDILGRSLASSSIISVGDNNKLTSINLTALNFELEPIKNFTVRVGGSYRTMESASPEFSLDYYIDDSYTTTSSEIKQTEISTILTFTPGRETVGYGVEREIINEEDFPTFFLNYCIGVKDIFNSDFDYERVQFFYNQPLKIGGLGRSYVNLEAGKNFGNVPLGLLSVVPGNQTYFATYNSFPVLNFYEFVTDTYLSAHLEHNFNGRLFSRIPLIRDLNLREIVGARAVWGSLSEENKAINASGLLLQAPEDGPYWEYSLGIGNILKFLRLDAHFRGNYFDNLDARSFAITASMGLHF
ncbi:DUF5686 and carboxypeptidase-like regulatory domain-containing protein [Autumnicola musiva]|uniref:DUF5686 family protein n=1 Tax=Autumnicola musiva TaxID=3075589 RepID=A0ABU3D6F9_9FLAO|nr:DUF5686 family protein [Zunongwangia sp. F117]MDT0677113.1 DUF5686 family protein [Zunongwangia sp. F117]